MSDDLRASAALERLYWGITKTKYVGPSASTPEAPLKSLPLKPTESFKPAPDRNLELAVVGLCDTLRTDNVTYFVGPIASQGSDFPQPTPGEIARRLLLDLRLIDPI